MKYVLKVSALYLLPEYGPHILLIPVSPCITWAILSGSFNNNDTGIPLQKAVLPGGLLVKSPLEVLGAKIHLECEREGYYNI